MNHELYPNGTRYLSEWVQKNTQTATAAGVYPLGKHLIVLSDGIRRTGLENVVLFNYHPSADFRDISAWHDVERVSRGCVFEKGTGKLLARAYPKFHRYGDAPEDSTLKHSDIEKIGYKEDGSLGIVFWYNNDWWVTTSGSLVSEQAYRATTLLHRYPLQHLRKDYTYMTEIIYPENRILTSYGNLEGLILLDILPLDANAQIDPAHIQLVREHVFTLVSEYSQRVQFDLNQPDVLQQLVSYCATQPDPNFEGFVVTFKNGLRKKFKSKAYLNAHRNRFDITVKRVKDMLLENPDLFLRWKQELPDEFFAEVDKIVQAIMTFAHERFKIIQEGIDSILLNKGISKTADTKHISRIIKQEVKLQIPTELQDAAWYYAKGKDKQTVLNRIILLYPVK